MTAPNSLTQSIANLVGIYQVFFEPGDGYLSLTHAELTQAWEDARQFRELTLLRMAKHAYAAAQPDPSTQLPIGEIANRCLYFAQLVLSPRQAAFAFDSFSSLLENADFEHAVNDLIPRMSWSSASPYNHDSFVHAITMGLNGTWIFAPDELTVTGKSPAPIVLSSETQLNSARPPESTKSPTNPPSNRIESGASNVDAIERKEDLDTAFDRISQGLLSDPLLNASS